MWCISIILTIIVLISIATVNESMYELES